jgi:hypothetical protein
MFLAPLAHPQEVLHKQLVYCVHITSAGCYLGAASPHNMHAIYKLLIHNKPNTKSATCWTYYTDVSDNLYLCFTQPISCYSRQQSVQTSANLPWVGIYKSVRWTAGNSKFHFPHLKKVLEMFSFSLQTHIIPNWNAVHCKSTFCKFSEPNGSI